MRSLRVCALPFVYFAGGPVLRCIAFQAMQDTVALRASPGTQFGSIGIADGQNRGGGGSRMVF
jgi:hypothetical protein